MKAQLYAIPNNSRAYEQRRLGHLKDDLKLLRGQWGSFRKPEYHRQVRKVRDLMTLGSQPGVGNLS